MEEKMGALHLAGTRSILDLCFSQDDERIFYVTNLGEYYQIWAIPSGGGYPRQVSFIEQGDVKHLQISPDGENIAFLVDYDGAETLDLFILPLSGGVPRNISNDLKITIPSLAWSFDSLDVAVVAEKDGNYNICVIDITNGESQWLTETEDTKMHLDWSPVGNMIAYTCIQSNQKVDICLANALKGKVLNLTEGFPGEHMEPHFSPDGATLAFTSDAKGMKNVALYNIERKAITWLPSGGREQTFLKWHPSGTRFTFMRNEDGEVSLLEADFPPSQIRKLTTSGYTGSLMAYGHTDDRTAMLLTTPTKPGDIYLRKEKTLRKLTDSMPYGFEPEHFVTPEKVRYPSFDGLEIPAFYYKPAGEEKYPVIMQIHGGPADQFLYTWNPLTQLLVKNGFAVFNPNIRGSSGYGKEFERRNYHDWGGDDLKDIIAGVEFLKQDPNADLSKLVIMGGSYGGYMTMMAAVKYPELWRCGINIMGPVNLTTFYQTASPWIKMMLNVKWGFLPPDEEPDYYFERSPINFIGKIACPLLLMYGKNDPRVSLDEMTQLRTELRNSFKIFEECVFEHEGHTLRRTDSKLDIYEKIVAFINTHLHSQEVEVSVKTETNIEEAAAEPEISKFVEREFLDIQIVTPILQGGKADAGQEPGDAGSEEGSGVDDGSADGGESDKPREDIPAEEFSAEDFFSFKDIPGLEDISEPPKPRL